MLAETPTRRDVLTAAKDPANWRPADVRPAMRYAARDLEPTSLRLFALWLIEKLNPRGELHRTDYKRLIEWSRVPRRSFFRYLAALEAAGLIEREGTAREVRPDVWKRVTVIRAGASFRHPEVALSQVTAPQTEHKPLTCESATSGTTPTFKGSYTGVAVGDLTTCSRQDEDQTRADEQWAVDNWPKMARSRTDLPSQRPGYSTNATRERLALDAWLDSLPTCGHCGLRHEAHMIPCPYDPIGATA